MNSFLKLAPSEVSALLSECGDEPCIEPNVQPIFGPSPIETAVIAQHQANRVREIMLDHLRLSAAEESPFKLRLN